tara:strand:- start:3277 stop:3801 length:525 start_codon:yes stop_codon:yes gene_type:complete
MPNFVNAKLASAIANAVSAATKSLRATQTAIDLFVAEGWRSTDLISPKGKDSKSTASEEKFAELNKAIVAGFTATTQKLLETNTKTLTETGKANKRYWQQQIGARRNDFKTALAKREDAKNGGANTKRSDAQRISDNLNDCSKVIENSEGISGVDLVKLSSAIKAAKSVLHAKF